MNHDENVDMILAKLTGTKEENKKYLKEQMLIYTKFSDGASIFKDIENKINTSYGPDIKAVLNETIKEYIDDINKKMFEAKKFMDEKKFSEARMVINDILEMSFILLYKNDDEEKFYFKNITEFLYSIRKINPNGDKKLVWGTPIISMPYNWLSYIENENKKYDKARKYCDKAISYDPMDSSLYFEKVESYISDGDLQNALKVLDEAYDNIFDHVNMALYYRKLGFINIQFGRLEIAFACYLVSLHFNLSNSAYNELEYIRHKLDNPSYNLTNKEVMDVLNKSNIPFGPKKENLLNMTSILNNPNYEKAFPEAIKSIKKEYDFFLKDMTSVEYLFK